MSADVIVRGVVVRGHRVASGLNGNPHFPGGTLRMQAPHFRERGLELSVFHPGTLNVSIAPRTYQVLSSKLTFRHVRWHSVDPPEDFSFFDVAVRANVADAWVEGLIYYPHPETKPTHFQSPDVLELLLPTLAGVSYGDAIDLKMRRDQIQLND